MTQVYVALPDAVLVTSDGELTRRLEGASPMCLAVDPSRRGRLYCGTWDRGLFRTEDGGDSWTHLGLEQVTAVAVNADGIAYAGTEPSALFRSEDAGATWTECTAMRELPSKDTWSFPPRPHTSHVRWITPDPEVRDRLFVCIEAGALLRSMDGGETWQDRRPDSPMDTHTLIAGGSGRLYSAAGDGFVLPGYGFSFSPDAGETWERPAGGLRDHYLWGIAVDDSDTIVVSASPGPQEAHGDEGAESTIYRRSGDGPWTESREGLPSREGTNAWVLAWLEDTFYAASNVGLFSSTDGAAWERRLELSGRAQAIVVTE